MIWFYRLQQRLSMTQREAIAIATLLGLFLLGIGVRHLQKQQIPPLEVDSLVARPVGDSSIEQTTNTEPDTPPPPSEADPIDVNSAPIPQLQRLPGVGPVLARRIDAYRSDRNGFDRIEDLRRVDGIGPKTLSTLRPLVRVSPAADTTE